MKWHASLNPWALLLLGRLDWGTRISFLKREKKGTQDRRITQLFFVCYQPKCHKGFTFTTTRCRLQLTQHILTFCVRRSLRTDSVSYGCRFANDFFHKITAHVPLIYWWYYRKMFTVNFYASCFVSRENSIEKKTYKTWLGKVCLPAVIYAG